VNQHRDAAGAASFGELFAQFASMASHVFWVYDLDPEENVVYVSPSFERIWGHPAADLYARHRLWMDCIHPEDRRLMAQRYEHWLNASGEDSYRMEFRILRPDGGVRWIFDHGRRVNNASGRAVRVIGIAEDITERKHAEAALRASEESLRAERDRLATVSSAAPGVLHSFRLTDDGRMSFPYASEKIRDVYGFEASELVTDAHKISERIHPDDRARVLQTTLHSMQTMTPWNQEFRILHPLRGEIWIESNSMPRREEGGTIWHGFLTDVTGRKRAERQQRHSQKLEALGTLAGGIAHDFNNLLLAIRGNTRLAMADLPADHAAFVSLGEVERAAIRATELVRQILSFSRQSDARREVVQLQPVVEDALKLLRSTLPAMIRINAHFQPDVPAIAVDVTQVHQIIMNLATNAAHAMGDTAGVLEVGVDAVSLQSDEVLSATDLHAGRYARITVSDNGCGMDRATLDRIFDPFFTTKPPGKGTGLGLSVVHGIVRGHDGAVRVYSQPGKGTTFRIYLPVSGKATARGADADVTEARGAGEHVMYIDDEESLVFLGKRVLEKLGYRVTGFSDPSQALLAFQQQPGAFDVVVTDLSMPGMSGFHLAGAMLKTRPDLPIVMTTGYVRPEDKEEARCSGIRELILKPNTIEELGRALDRIFRQIREHSERDWPASS
jgi:PAS domain S-box-containing protein